MLDTNIYDALVLGKGTVFAKAVRHSDRVVVYGNKVIRGELRRMPRGIKWNGRNARNWLLNTYDFVVGRHNLETGEVVNFLALKYWDEYNGAQSFGKIISDFIIVACASIHSLDIVCSEDNRTMRTKGCLRIYRKVNRRDGLRIPRFIGFREFEKLV